MKMKENTTSNGNSKTLKEMKTNQNVKIKENITLTDLIQAVKSIVSSYFHNGEYTPYYSGAAAIIAIVKHFITGVDLTEDETIYQTAMAEPGLHSLVRKFLNENPSNEEDKVYANLMSFVRNQVYDMVEFKKQAFIHHTDELTRITDFFGRTMDTLEQFTNINLNALSPDNIETASQIMEKLKDKDITVEALAEAVKDTVSFDFPENEIIEGQRRHIEEQNQRIRMLEATIDSMNRKDEQPDNEADSLNQNAERPEDEVDSLNQNDEQPDNEVDSLNQNDEQPEVAIQALQHSDRKED